MSPNKFDAALRSLTMLARKVYDATPAMEPWPVHTIMAEMQRLGSSRNELRIVMGCLNSLMDDGLVCEPTKAHFQRTEVREKKPLKPIHIAIASQPEKTPMNFKDPEPHGAVRKTQPPAPVDAPTFAQYIDRITEQITRMRALADTMENTALELMVHHEKSEKEIDKLRQFKALLKDL